MADGEMFHLSISSGRGQCGDYSCSTRKRGNGRIPKGVATVRVNIGSGYYAKTFCRTCFTRTYGTVMRSLINDDPTDYEKAYQILMEYWNCIPEEDRTKVDERLKLVGV